MSLEIQNETVKDWMLCCAKEAARESEVKLNK